MEFAAISWKHTNKYNNNHNIELLPNLIHMILY